MTVKLGDYVEFDYGSSTKIGEVLLINSYPNHKNMYLVSVSPNTATYVDYAKKLTPEEVTKFLLCK